MKRSAVAVLKPCGFRFQAVITDANFEELVISLRIRGGSLLSAVLRLQRTTLLPAITVPA